MTSHVIQKIVILTLECQSDVSDTFTEDVEMLLETVSSVGQDFSIMLKNNMYSDITFVCQGVKIAAHRVIVASRCPALAAMLSNGLMESRMSEIPINFSAEVRTPSPG